MTTLERRKPPPKRTYSTFLKAPPKAGYAPGDVLKLGKNQVARYQKDPDKGGPGQGGYYAVPKVAVRPTKQVVRPVTQQNAFSTIETPAQIEARVTKMADLAYNRQKGDLDTEAARMRKEAEGRRLGMIAAYQAAAKDSMGDQVQSGWNVAADKIQGLAETTTGGISDVLKGDLATQEQALSRVGAGGTGFDAESQRGVEAYRGGTIPSDYFAREGGISNEYFDRMAGNVKNQGMQTAYSTEAQALQQISGDRLSQIKDLGTNRLEYEAKLREQLLSGRADQIDAVTAANKLVSDARNARAKLDQQYLIAKMNATTKMDLAKIDAIYKQGQLQVKRDEVAALNAQRYASGQASLAQANLAGVKANDIIAHPGTGGGRKGKTPKTIAELVGEASKQVGQGGINVPPRRVIAKQGPQKGKMVDVPYSQRLFEYLWSAYKERVPAAQQPALKRKLLDLASKAPKPRTTGAASDPFAGLPS